MYKAQNAPKRRQPKHLEKMLFINHKEDLVLQERLDTLTLRSKLNVMEIERERMKVRNEMRSSRKRNIVVDDALTNPCTPRMERKESVSHPNQFNRAVHPTNVSDRRMSTSAPQKRRVSIDAVAQSLTIPRRNSNFRQQAERRGSNANVLRRPSMIPEEDGDPSHGARLGKRSRAGSLSHPGDESDTGPIDSVGAYVLGEFKRISQVVPSILMALSRKDEEDKETADTTAVQEEVSEGEYQPDVQRVTKLANSVKKLKHRMSISKKMEACRPNKSLDQMIKERMDSTGDNDEFTDGTCVLMKRKLQKRRDSAPVVFEAASMLPRRQSMFAPGDAPVFARRASTAAQSGLEHRRASSSQQLPKLLTRSITSLSQSSLGRSSRYGNEAESKPHIIDEDELYNRQRVVRELENYDGIKEKIDRFLLAENQPVSGSISSLLDKSLYAH